MAEVGSTTLSRSTQRGKLRRIVFAWTSHTNGAVSGKVSGNVQGKILGCVTIPGTPAPTDNYDVTIINQDGFDVLNGRGADRDTANTEQFCPAVPFTDGTTAGVTHVVVHGTLELRITNAGSQKQGQVILILE